MDSQIPKEIAKMVEEQEMWNFWIRLNLDEKFYDCLMALIYNAHYARNRKLEYGSEAYKLVMLVLERTKLLYETKWISDKN